MFGLRIQLFYVMIHKAETLKKIDYHQGCRKYAGQVP